MDRLTREQFGLTDERWEQLQAERFPPEITDRRPAQTTRRPSVVQPAPTLTEEDRAKGQHLLKSLAAVEDALVRKRGGVRP